MVILRALATWLLIIAVETVHGIARNLLLVPILGDFHARQVSVFTGCALIFGVAYLMSPWIGARTRRVLLGVGALWVILTVLFEVALGRFVLKLPWSRITEDYDLTRGGLLGIGLLFMAATPSLVSKMRGELLGKLG